MRFALALALALAACSTPEPAPVASEAVELEPLELTFARPTDDTPPPREGPIRIYAFEGGDPAIREWSLGGDGDLSAIAKRLLDVEPVACVQPGTLVSLELTRYRLLVARTPTHFGLVKTVQPYRGPVTMSLVPDRSLSVDVVDLAGEPMLDVEVRLIATRRDAVGESWVASRARTDAHGCATLVHAGWVLARDLRVAVEVGSPLGDRVVREISAIEPVPLRLQLGRGATVVVTTEPLPRLGWPEYFRVELCSQAEADLGRSGVLAYPSAEGARFDFVAPGASVLALARFGGNTVVARAEVRDERGEPTYVPLDLAFHDRFVVGRAVDPAGAPLAGADLDVRSSLLGESAWGAAKPGTECDGEGRFLVGPLDAGSSGLEQVWSFCARRGERVFEFELDRTRCRYRGITDVGELRFRPADVLVSGHVVDDVGRPVVHAEVFVFPGQPMPGESAPSRGRVVSTRTGARGEFRFHGGTGAAHIAVEASVPTGGTPTRDVVARGSTVELVVARRGSISGSVVCPAGLEGARMLVNARRRGALGDERDPPDASAGENDRRPLSAWSESIKLRPGEDVRFALRELDAGRYSVLLCAQSGATLSAIDVDVRPGEVCRDPRLERIDLAPFVHTLDVTVTSRASGASLAGALYRRPAGTLDRWESSESADGRFEITSLEPEFELVIAAPGHRWARFARASGVVRTALEPPIQVEIELAEIDRDLADVLGGECGARVLGGNLPDALREARIPFEFDRRGRARFEVPSSGTWRIRWHARTRDGREVFSEDDGMTFFVESEPSETPRPVAFPGDFRRRIVVR